MRTKRIFVWFVSFLITLGSVQAQGGTYLLREGFESETFPPTGWTQEKVAQREWTGDRAWVRSDWNFHEGMACAMLQDMHVGNINNLISPAINIPTANAYEVSFWIKRVPSDKPNEGVKVWVSSTTDTANGTMLLHVPRSDSHGPAAVGGVDGWYKYNVTIPTSGMVHVIFEGISEYDGVTCIDDVLVRQIPGCSAPSGLVVSNIEYTSADLSWSDASNNTSWRVYYKSTLDATWQEQTVSATNLPLSGLTLGTQYEVKIYALCSDGSLSDVLSGVFTTKRGVPYLETFSYEGAIPYDWDYYTGALEANSVLVSGTPGSSDWFCPRQTSSFTTAMDRHLRGYIGGNRAGRWIVSPTIHLTEEAWVEMDVILSANSTGTENPSIGNGDKFAVVVSLDGGTTWSIQNATIWSGDTTGGNHNYLGEFDKQKKHIVIPLENNSGASYLGFGVKIALYFESSESSDGNWIHIDNLAVNPRQWCLTPMDFALVGDPTQEGASFRITQGVVPASNWEYELVELESNFTGVATGIINAGANVLYHQFNVDDLTALTTYKIRVRTVCGSDIGEWTDSVVFRTRPMPVTLPWTCDFETPNLPWTFSTIEGGNSWTVSNNVALGEGSTRAMHITKDPGTKVYEYNMSGGCIAYAYVDIMGGTGTEYQLSFDWRCRGEGSWDFFRVMLVDIESVLPQTYSEFASGYTSDAIIAFNENNDNKNYFNYIGPNSEDTVFRYTGTLPEIPTGTVKRLVFAWRNDSGGGSQPPAAIDNLEIAEVLCSLPTIDSIVVENITPNGVSLTVASSDLNIYPDMWLFTLTSGTTTLYYSSDVSSVNISDLTANTRYQVQISRICGIDTSMASLVTTSFETPCTPTPIPWAESFSTSPFDNCWTRGEGHLPATGPAHVQVTLRNGWNHNTSADFAPMPSGRVYGMVSHNYDSWLITPPVDLGDGSEQMQLDFEVLLTRNYASATAPYANSFTTDDRFVVLISTDYGATWSMDNAWAWDSAGTYQPYSSLTNTKQRVIIPLTKNGVNYSGVVQIAFYLESHRDTSYNYNYLHLDNVQITPYQDCLNPIDLRINSMSANSVSIDWTSSENSIAWQYEIVENDATSTFVGAGVDIIEHPYTITGLNPDSDYKVRVRTSCGGGEYSSWTDSVAFRTLKVPTVLPYVNDFESENSGESFTFVQKSGVNHWVVDTGANNGGSKALYITSDTTTHTWYYDTDVTSISYAYIDIAVTEGADYELSFDWQADGESTWDFLKIFVTDPSEQLPAYISSSTSSYSIGGVDLFSQTTTWNRVIAPIVNISAPEGVKRIAFAWKNDGSGGSQPPAAIDNIVIKQLVCPGISGLSLDNLSTTGARISWDSSAASYTFYYGEVTGTDTVYNSNYVEGVSQEELSDLTPNTTYVAYVVSECDGTQGDPSPILSFRTPFNLPFVCDFEAETQERNYWQYLPQGGENTWIIDTATKKSGQYSMYISNNVPQNTYSDNGLTFAYIDVAFTDAEGHTLSFDWKGQGEGSSDYLFVAIRDAGDPLPTSYSSVGVLSFNGNKYLSDNTSWEHAEAILGNEVQNKVKRIYFGWKSDADELYQPAGAIDNVSLVALTCVPPTDFNVSGVTTNSITVNATQEGVAGYVIFVQEGTTVTQYETTTLPYTIPGLSHSTEYRIALKTVCMAGDTSYMTGWQTATTPCASETVPFYEPFTDVPANCWERKKGVFADSISTGSLITSTQWSQDNDGFGDHVSINIYGQDRSGWIISPTIDLGTGTACDLSFNMWLNQYNSMIAPETIDSDDKFMVLISTDGGASWLRSNATVWTGDATDTIDRQLSAIPINRTRYVIPLDQYSGEIRFAFYGESTVNDDADFNLRIDSIAVEQRAACPAPYTITVSNITSNSAEISWTEGGSATSWIIKANGVETTVTANPYVVTGLPAASEITVGVKAVCGEGSESAWTYTTFTTGCGVVTLPYENSFTALPACWDIMEGLFQEGIATTSLSFYTGSPTSFEAWRAQNLAGRYHMSLDICGSSTSDWLISPVMDLGASGAGVALSFNMWFTHYGTSNPAGGNIDDDKFMVLISTDAGATWSTANATEWNMTNTGAYRMDSIPSIPTRFTIPLDNYSGQIRIAFYGESTVLGGDNELRIDSVLISAGTAPVCEAPTNVTSSGITTTSATIAWTENGSATSWKIDYNGTEVTVSDNPHTLTGLTANTAYTVKVKAVCGTDSESAWSATHTFNTPEETQPVCEAPTNVTSSGITTTSATIAWTENGSATSWKIDYNGTEVTVSDNPHTLTGLTANTAYTVKVKSVCGTDSESAWSVTHTFNTPEETQPVCEAPTNVTSSGITTTSATIAWTENGSATSWKIDYNGTEVTVSDNPHTLTGLTANTAYTVKVKSVCGTDSESAWSATHSFRTGHIESVVTTVEATDVDSTSATLNATVTAGTDQITARGFEWRLTEATVFTPVEVTSSEATFSHTLTGLTPATSYSFRAYIVVDGEKRYGALKDFVTKEVGIDDVTTFAGLRMFPNPATEQVTVEVGNVNGTVKFILTDLNGRVVWTAEKQSEGQNVNTTIDVSRFSEGAYYLRIQNGAKVATQKLIVQ